MGIEDGEIIEAIADLLERDRVESARSTDDRGNPLYMSCTHHGDVPLALLIYESIGRAVHRELERRRRRPRT